MKVFSSLIIAAVAVHITLFPVLELGHEVLHLLKTRFHNHVATHSHSIKDHHIEIANTGHEQDCSPIAAISFILVGFTKSEPILIQVTSAKDYQHCTEMIRIYTSLTIQPPAIPPAY